MRLADQIRRFVATEYIQPARTRGQKTVTIRAGDVHSAMGLSHRHPAVCSALRAKQMELDNYVVLVGTQGPEQGANVYFTFQL